MAAPTFAQAWVKTKAVVNVLQKIKNFGHSDATNLVDLLQTAEDAVKADNSEAGELSEALSDIRGNFNDIVSRPRDVLDPCVRLIAKSVEVASSAETIEGMVADIYDYMARNVQHVKRRAFTRGAFVNGSPYVGDGVHRRVTMDAFGFPLEASQADVYTARCIRDQNTGAVKGKEVWRLSPKPFVDFVELGRTTGRGQGKEREFASVNGDDSLLLNPSFSDRVGTDALPTEINNWTSSVAVIGDGTDYQITRVAGEIFQASLLEGGNPGALRVYLARELTQALSLKPISVNPAFPYHLGIAWRSNASAPVFTGTLTIHMGSKSVAVTIAAQTGFQILAMPTAVSSDLYPRNWNADGATIKIAVTKTSGAGSYLVLDRVMFMPYYFYEGAGWFYLPVSGATNWLLESKGTITDTEVGAVLQDWWGRAYGTSLPSDAAPSITDPA